MRLVQDRNQPDPNIDHDTDPDESSDHELQQGLVDGTARAEEQIPQYPEPPQGVGVGVGVAGWRLTRSDVTLYFAVILCLRVWMDPCVVSAMVFIVGVRSLLGGVGLEFVRDPPSLLLRHGSTRRWQS